MLAYSPPHLSKVATLTFGLLNTSPSRYNATDSSSACLFLLSSNKTAEYCSVEIISRRLLIARLVYGDDETELTDSWSAETVGASRRNVNTSRRPKLSEAPLPHELPVDTSNGRRASPGTTGRCRSLTQHLTKSCDKEDKNEVKKISSNPRPSRITRETILLGRFTLNEGGNGNRSLQNLFWKFGVAMATVD
ncbi:hypothetical protein AVEN_81712-1 [Araneus ventricosus]|uniref:Uncharacterized protein n=1 Tax=Araneus ventricosus TaxID=182803 RepID=A0A4Y2ICQ8_ARAVE|nr:hypothetical protein AVEN_81712-1 [Araneus ventricosus]